MEFGLEDAAAADEPMFVCIVFYCVSIEVPACAQLSRSSSHGGRQDMWLLIRQKTRGLARTVLVARRPIGVG